MDVEIKLTGTLVTHGAVVIKPGEEYPKEYHGLATAYLDDGVVEIAVPEALSENYQLLYRLSIQAGDCLYRAFEAHPEVKITDMRDN